MTRKFLDEIYVYDGPMQQIYAEWAQSYDAEVAANGYATPERCAAALREAGADPARAVLDMGCGTGLSGLALRMAGFEVIDGIDITDAMVEQARARGIYRNLSVGDAAEALASGDYAAVSAVGIFSPSHAPAALIDDVLQALPAGGRFVFSLNDHALAERTYEGRVMAWTDAGAARCLFREHGPHLPGQDIEATVYVLQKN